MHVLCSFPHLNVVAFRDVPQYKTLAIYSTTSLYGEVMKPFYVDPLIEVGFSHT